jgi:F-type H+-transporting ATPase subunit b
MLFDWFTLIAQLINFLVLVWLLKRYLFKPILNAIDEREKLIAGQLLEAEASKAAAGRELIEFQQKNNTFNQQRHELLNIALGEINAERQKLLEQTRGEVEALRLQLRQSLRSEHQNLGSEIIRRTRIEVFSIVRKTLSDLAAVNLEDQMAIVFISRINRLTPDEKELFYTALTHSFDKVCVRSTFDVSVTQQAAIQSAINKNLNIETDVRFETVPEAVSGIELISDGYKISWSIEEYLKSLETHISELLSEQTLTA